MDEIEGEEDQPNPIDGAAERHLLLPRAYDTATTVILVANNLGDEGWERISSRLKVFIWDPFPEEQIADLRTWDPPVPGAILGVIESCHRKGEVLNLDYRAVLEAIDALAWACPGRTPCGPRSSARAISRSKRMPTTPWTGSSARGRKRTRHSRSGTFTRRSARFGASGTSHGGPPPSIS